MPEEKQLTIVMVMERTGAKRSTVRKWCVNGKLPNARLRESETGEKYWSIPESDLEGIDEIKVGRPKKED